MWVFLLGCFPQVEREKTTIHFVYVEISAFNKANRRKLGRDIRGLVEKSKSKCVARNEMESGLENGTSRFKLMLFNRKEN